MVTCQLVEPRESDATSQVSVESGKRILHQQQLRGPWSFEIPDHDEPVPLAFLLRALGFRPLQLDDVISIAARRLEFHPDVFGSVNGIGANVGLIADVLKLEPGNFTQ